VKRPSWRLGHVAVFLCVTVCAGLGRAGETPGGQRRLRTMLRAAETLSRGLAEVRQRRGRTTPLALDEQLVWMMRAMEAGRRLADTPEERLEAIRRYVGACKALRERVRTRRQLDASRVALGVVDYALAEAECLLAEALVRHGPAGQRAAQRAAATRAGRAALAAAGATAKDLDAIEPLRSRGVIESWELRRRWAWRVMQARRRPAADAKQEAAAVREYRGFCRHLLGKVALRRTIDATVMDLAAAKHAVAEADYVLAGVLARRAAAGGGPAAEPAPAKEQSARAMLAAARKVMEGFEAARAAGVRSGATSVLLTQRHWAHKVMAAEVHLARTARERTAAITRYLAYCRTVRRHVEARKIAGATALDALAAEYYVAEAEHMLARE